MIFATSGMACSNYVGENEKDFLKFNESVFFSSVALVKTECY